MSPEPSERHKLALRIDRLVAEVTRLGGYPRSDECGHLIEALKCLEAGHNAAGEEALSKAENGWPCPADRTDPEMLERLLAVLDCAVRGQL